MDTYCRIFCFHFVDSLSTNPKTIYSSNLTIKSAKYSPNSNSPNHFYESIQINVTEDGVYTFAIDNTIDTQAYIYKTKFIPLIPSLNGLEIVF